MKYGTFQEYPKKQLDYKLTKILESGIFHRKKKNNRPPWRKVKPGYFMFHSINL